MTIPERVLLVTVFIISLALGYYLGHAAKPVSNVKTNSQVKTDTTQHEIITQTKKPDGTETTITQVDTIQDSQSKASTEAKLAPVQPKYNISGIVATSIHEPTVPMYGVSVSKEFIGLRVGALALTSGVVGVSLGIDF